jgi:iron complex transport system permease protein
MKALTPARLAIALALAFAGLAVACLVAPEFGSADASLWRVIMGSATAVEREIVLSIRLPRVLLACLAGGSLAVCGVSMQGTLGNPLASPYTLGFASSAGFLAVVAMKLGARLGTLAGAAVPLAAFSGAMLAAGAVWGLSRLRRAGHMTPEGLLLAGVTLSFIASAGVLLVQYLSSPFEVAQMVDWLMGRLGGAGARELATLAPVLLPGLALLFVQAGRLNQIAVSEEVALSRGVDVRRVRGAVLVGTALAVGAVVAVAGPVGFVGLIVPHAVRSLAGPDHRMLMPVAFLSGAAFLVVCDTVARTVMAPSEIPVGVLTSLIGGPFFLWILATKRSRG